MKEETRRAREAWIEKFRGYFGEPFALEEYRSGEISFDRMHSRAVSHVEDMLSEAKSCEWSAFED